MPKIIKTQQRLLKLQRKMSGVFFETQCTYIITSPAVGERSIVISLCVHVCLSANISLEPLDRSSPVFVHIHCGRGSMLLWRRCDVLCASGVMDIVTFARDGTYVTFQHRGEV